MRKLFELVFFKTPIEYDMCLPGRNDENLHEVFNMTEVVYLISKTSEIRFMSTENG